MSSVPVTLMPFGKRLLTSAVEGESKQSCVIFPFYFMSLAATTHDSCGSLANTIILCIILIVLYMNIRYYCLCTCIFIVDSSYFLFRKGRTLCKSTKISWIMCQILSFSVCHSKYFTQLFGKSALGASRKLLISTFYL